jgi:hypothetical protein
VDDTDPGDVKSASDLTRYLAAAAYLDEAFRDDVLSQTLERRHRFIGPAYGVDIPCVVRHCLASLRLSRIRDVILSVLLFFALRGLGIPLMYFIPVLGVSALVLAGLSSRKLKFFVRVLLYAAAYIGFFAGDDGGSGEPTGDQRGQPWQLILPCRSPTGRPGCQPGLTLRSAPRLGVDRAYARVGHLR